MSSKILPHIFHATANGMKRAAKLELLNMAFSHSTKTQDWSIGERIFGMLPACCCDYRFGMWYYLYVVAFQKSITVVLPLRNTNLI